MDFTVLVICCPAWSDAAARPVETCEKDSPTARALSMTFWRAMLSFGLMDSFEKLWNRPFRR